MPASDPRLPQPVEVDSYGRAAFPNGQLPRGWTEMMDGPALPGDYDLSLDKHSGMLQTTDDPPGWNIVVGVSIIEDTTYGIYRPWPKLDRELTRVGRPTPVLAAPAAPDGWVVLTGEDTLFRGDMILRTDGSVRSINENALRAASSPVPVSRILGLNDGCESYAQDGEPVRVLAVIRHPAVHAYRMDNRDMRASNLIDRLFETPAHAAKPRPKVKLPKSIHSIPLPLP